MLFEDASALTWAAAKQLESRKQELDCPNLRILTVPEFLHSAHSARLTRAEKELLLDQATILIDQFYAHLPFKRERYAVDPVRDFRLLRAQIDSLSELAFHEKLIRAFMRLRDAHTFYGLPAPFCEAFAFLPLHVDSYFDPHGRRRFLVTALLRGFDHPHFTSGAEIVLWRGMPVERAIEREADFEPGCNAASHFIRGLNRLARRSLAYSPPPDEHYTVVEYVPAGGGERRSIVLPWCIATGTAPKRRRASSHASINDSMAQLQRLHDMLFVRAQSPAGPADLSTQSRYPEVFEFHCSGAPDGESLRDDAHPDRKFGYIRIRTFDLDLGAEDATGAFLSEFTRILALMKEAAPDGLILDVRSNPGGSIGAAERILQLLTPWDIQPAKFHFINSNLTQQIAFHVRQVEAKAQLDKNQREWLPWVTHLAGNASEGRFVTPGEHLTSFDSANDTGQQYTGPVTLITDALSYSATDIFAAGFQDHGIGPIIGVDASTGGGGANRWLHDELREKLEKSAPMVRLHPLPRGAQMGFAARRSSRVGPREGAVIEDEGVACDVAYRLTQDDVLHADRDLLRFACQQLSLVPTGQVTIVKADLQTAAVALTLTSNGLHRIECSLDGRPQASFAADGVQPFLIPVAGLADPPSVVRVDGFALVAGPGGVPVFQLVARAQAGLTVASDTSAAAPASA